MWRSINRLNSVNSVENLFALKSNLLVRHMVNPIRNEKIRTYSNSAVDRWIESLSPGQKEKMRFIQNEIKLHELEHKVVPQLEKLSIHEYSEMLNMSNNKRHKYYNYLHNSHWKATAETTKQDLRGKLAQVYESEIRKSNEDIDGKYREYGLGKNCYLPKIYNRTIDALKNRSVFRQMILNGPKIVLDLGFSSELTPRENLEAARQLIIIMAENRRHRVPFVVHFCNAHPGNKIANHLRYFIPNLHKQPLYVHEEDFLDVLPKEKLVILTPDSPNVLEKYNSLDHYVISAIVDRGDKKPLTLSKAKKFDLRTARLPLEQYRSVRQNKVLTLNQIFNVMLDIKLYKDWNIAFNHIAPRKFK